MRGERRCHCWGEILVMLGNYGWIMAFDDIDHPDLAKTAGRIYIHKRDVENGATLVEGDTVSFYVYADSQGLGAECCQLEKRAWPRSMDTMRQAAVAPSFRADAAEFVPNDACQSSSWNKCAAEFVPAPVSTSTTAFSVQAPEFVPSSFSTMSTAASEFVPNTVTSGATHFAASTPCSNMLFNLAFFSDDESDDESCMGSGDACSGDDADKESSDTDQESSNESVQSFHGNTISDKRSHLNVVLSSAPWKSSRVSSSDDGSTSAGASSDSGEDGEDEAMRFSALAARLDFPRGVRPPPGLRLPVCAA
jgi:hypothetical protein